MNERKVNGAATYDLFHDQVDQAFVDLELEATPGF